jgi:hypothetical protein
MVLQRCFKKTSLSLNPDVSEDDLLDVNRFPNLQQYLLYCQQVMQDEAAAEMRIEIHHPKDVLAADTGR